MKKAIISGIVVLSAVIMAKLVKADPVIVLIVMIAYWVFLDRLEREGKNND